MTLSEQIVASFFEQRRQGIPGAIRHQARLHIADHIGIALAARERSEMAQAVRMTLQVPAAVQGYRPGAAPSQYVPVPPAFLAFATSAYGHILDFDDIHDRARVHPTTVTAPAALAAASVADACGAELVEAVAMGNELMCRMGTIWLPVGSGPGADWFLSQLFGYFGAALAASMVLRMNPSETCAALGLAYMQAAGGKEAGFGTGSNARALYPAFAALGGVHAALLARAGIIGPASAFDGAANFFRLYFGRDLDAEQMQQLLDSSAWVWQDTHIKPWPCCRLSHPYVYAAQHLREQMNLGGDLSKVRKIVVQVNPSAAKLCSPIEERRRPRTLQDAKYSIPFVVAFTLVRGEVTLDTLDENALEDPQVLAMAQRVVVEETAADEPGLPLPTISVEREGGNVQSFSKRFELPPSEPRVRSKFLACLEYAGLSAQAESAWNASMSLDGSDGQAIRQLMGVMPVRGAA